MLIVVSITTLSLLFPHSTDFLLLVAQNSSFQWLLDAIMKLQALLLLLAVVGANGWRAGLSRPLPQAATAGHSLTHRRGHQQSNGQSFSLHNGCSGHSSGFYSNNHCYSSNIECHRGDSWSSRLTSLFATANSALESTEGTDSVIAHTGSSETSDHCGTADESLLVRENAQNPDTSSHNEELSGSVDTEATEKEMILADKSRESNAGDDANKSYSPATEGLFNHLIKIIKTQRSLGITNTTAGTRPSVSGGGVIEIAGIPIRSQYTVATSSTNGGNILSHAKYLNDIFEAILECAKTHSPYEAERAWSRIVSDRHIFDSKILRDVTQYLTIRNDYIARSGKRTADMLCEVLNSKICLSELMVKLRQ